MSVSALFVLDVKGRILIYRDYRGDISIKYAEKFMTKINELEDSGKLSPIMHDDGVTYIYLQHMNVYLLAVTRENINATAVVLFLHRLVEVFKHYFQELEEESIRDNFVVVYELLDEVCSRRQSSQSLVCWGLFSCRWLLLSGDGLWISSVHRSTHLIRIHQNRCLQNGGKGHILDQD
jgi:hypothetical protein